MARSAAVFRIVTATAALALAQAAFATAFGGSGLVSYTGGSDDTWCGTGAAAQMNFSGTVSAAASPTGTFTCASPHYYGAYYLLAYPAATATPTNTVCDQDLDGDGLQLDAPVPGSLDIIPGSFTCQRYDNYVPSGTVTYASGWTNSTTNLTASLADLGGSNVKRYQFQYRTADANPLGAFAGAWLDATGTGCLVDGLNATGATANCNWLPSAVSGNAYEFQVSVWDNAGNLAVVSAPGRVLKFDNTPPAAGDVADTQGGVPQGSKFYASTVNYALTVGDGDGAPVVSAAYSLTEVGGSNPVRSSATSASASSPFAMALDMTDVDFKADAGGVASRNADGTRTYTLTIGSVTDEAGNTAAVNKSFTYYAVADARTSVSVAPDASAVTDAPADGLPRALAWKVTDQYGNAVVPDAGIGRTVALSMSGVNSVQLDQLRRAGGSAIFASEPANSASYSDAYFAAGNFAKTQSYAAISPDFNDGSYRFRIKAYAPTAYARAGYKESDVASQLTFTAVTATAANGAAAYNENMNLDAANGTNAVPASATPTFKPLYDVVYSGDYREAGTLNDTIATGLNQSALDITDNSPSVTAAAPSLGVLFTVPSAAQLANFVMKHGSAAADTATTQIAAGDFAPMPVSALSATFPAAGATVSVPLFSDLTQSGTADIGQTVLSFHVSYVLDGHDVAYNGDVLNRPSYWGGTSSAMSRQMAAKVTGAVSNTEGYQAVDTDQQNGVLVLGNSSKFASKSAVHKRAFSIANGYDGAFMPGGVTSLDATNPAAISSNGGKYLANSAVILYKGVARVDVGPADVAAGGRVSLLVIGGDVYVRGNVNANGDPDASVGIVAVADENGSGGNIYVDPAVTNIDAVLYADKALVSFDGTAEMGGNTRSRLLANQLLIHGSVLSENTLGGAVNASGLRCPYFVPQDACDQDSARKYDLNYLRRYRLSTDSTTGTQSPAWGAKVAGNVSCDASTGACGVSALRTLFSNSNSGPGSANDATGPTYALYPLVVQYNPRTLANPPPVFDPSDLQ